MSAGRGANASSRPIPSARARCAAAQPAWPGSSSACSWIPAPAVPAPPRSNDPPRPAAQHALEVLRARELLTIVPAVGAEHLVELPAGQASAEPRDHRASASNRSRRGWSSGRRGTPDRRRTRADAAGVAPPLGHQARAAGHRTRAPNGWNRRTERPAVGVDVARRWRSHCALFWRSSTSTTLSTLVVSHRSIGVQQADDLPTGGRHPCVERRRLTSVLLKEGPHIVAREHLAGFIGRSVIDDDRSRSARRIGRGRRPARAGGKAA